MLLVMVLVVVVVAVEEEEEEEVGEEVKLEVLRCAVGVLNTWLTRTAQPSKRSVCVSHQGK